ncbi:phenazine biosynthesis-like domain-containing protein isoform X1 [Anguilla anguilla]|uniref:Phenazine biosynthesis-like domain-containing protein n=1 Tax=Anguilla anguilla TaxID=7936 RepID=A0A9D3LJC8_ANGAN|nr:phenazine biosynthesis-like domain-containing protein isoform X1 [Anguilla anguilla]XP_035256730.1 phenazine biosynthesis-like domain-containing protein isoform X1 [Anguilla anguilla]XP_035256731.1 phenazine biosynthesis-like domain-containing protein isoform X1 [Anguilla anguilla]XP_035256732.1 phenazine biosynthesis-like domain-containing protein isoform X1 [Anguilla anguilla]XP_035256733.1 phenazine biosynthesis-like domain-containing protein isoform X1 [Anguilla anguilla]KAG5831246.1 hy
MEIPVFTVDAFTNQAFKGNPAAVCLLPNVLRDELYQKIAAEMNLSETAFIVKLNSSDDFTSGSRFGLRWFTPMNEVTLCGHATLASAAVLFYHKKNQNAALVFETLSGELYARLHGDSIVMDFPLHKPVAQDPSEVKDTVNATVRGLSVQDLCYSAKTKKLLIRLSDSCDRSVLTSLQPNASDLLRSDSTGRIKGVIVTVKGAPTAQPGYDFFSRYFAPWYGIAEDPVTGSAHSVLAGYWSEKLGKERMLDDRITALREISIQRESATVRQTICGSFGLNAAHVILKVRNSRGSLIPLNSSIPANSKHAPYVLEVVKIFQHVVPRPCINDTTVINKSMKTRLQSIVRRIERLEELVPQIKLRRHEKVNQEIKLLSQKLVFLNKRMQMADSHCWSGMFVRPPLW